MDKIVYWIVIVLLVMSNIVLACLVKTSEEEPVYVDSVIIKSEQPGFFLEDEPTDSLVRLACEYYNIKHIDIVVAQSILETGHYKSYQCRVNHNLFGLYNSKKKEFFKFNHWTESVKAYYDFIQYKYKGGDYYQFLEDINYAEDSIYVAKVKTICNKISKQ